MQALRNLQFSARHYDPDFLASQKGRVSRNVSHHSYCLRLLRRVGLYEWTARESEGITLLVQLIEDIYAVLLAFMIVVIWTQFTEVES